jgi:microcompartment protein CcmK/EutM
VSFLPGYHFWGYPLLAISHLDDAFGRQDAARVAVDVVGEGHGETTAFLVELLVRLRLQNEK